MRLIFLFTCIHLGYLRNNRVYSAEVSLPDAPGTINVENVTDISAHISWSRPVSNITILRYKVVPQVIRTFSNNTLFPTEWTFSNNTFRTEISGLHPGTKYNLTIRAISENGTGVEMWKVFETVIGDPGQVPPNPQILKNDGQTMSIKLTPVSNNNGPISFYRLIVKNTYQNQVFQQDLLQSHEKAAADDLSYYITAEIAPEAAEKEFVIGDGRYYNGYFNAPLDKGTQYNVFAGVVSTWKGVTKISYPAAMNSVLQTDMDFGNSDLVLGLSIAVAVASVLLVASVVILILLRNRYQRNRRQRLSDNQELCIQGPMIQVANQGYIPDEECAPVNHYKVLKEKIWNIPRDCLQVNKGNIVGFGTFGHVVKGEVRRENTVTPVLCYLVTDGDMRQEEKRNMLRQLDILVKADKHENLISFIGTSENADTVFVVLEHMSMSFKDLLLKQRNLGSAFNKSASISEQQILDLLTGIARGMDHLSKNNLIHERLCARSVLMSEGFVPKITNHGLSHYNKDNLAIDFTRWTAPEVFKRKQFLKNSDVWSYGCLIWEACSFGGTPYSTLESRNVAQEVSRGVRLPKLSYISEEFYQLMLNCWQYDAEERPAFFEILQQLQYFKDTLTFHDHINFDNFFDLKFEPFIPAMEVIEENIMLT